MDPPEQSQLASIFNFKTIFTGIPSLTKYIAATLVSFYLIGLFFSSFVHYMALIPGNVIPPSYYYWNFLTSGFVEVTPVTLIVNVFAVLTVGKYLELVWGWVELLKFIIVVTLSCSLFTEIAVIFFYGITADEASLFSQYYCGFSGVTAGFAVALKQLLPEAELIFFRAKHFPGIIVVITLVLWIVFGATATISRLVPFIFAGTYFSWVYLRFFQKRYAGISNVPPTKTATSGGWATSWPFESIPADQLLVGDLSDSFSFATFFPEFFQPVVGWISEMIYRVLKLFGFGKAAIASRARFIDVTAASLADPVDAERRRNRALQAVDQRMAQVKIVQDSALPSTPTIPTLSNLSTNTNSNILPHSNPTTLNEIKIDSSPTL